jgi:hypothetical protein
MKNFKHYLELVTEVQVTNVEKMHPAWGKGTTVAQDAAFARTSRIEHQKRIAALKETAKLLKEIEAFPTLADELNSIKYINNIKELVTPENIDRIENWYDYLKKVFATKTQLEKLTGAPIKILELRIWLTRNKDGYFVGDFSKTIKDLNKILTNRIAAAKKSKRGAKLTTAQKQKLVQGKGKIDAGNIAAHWEKRTEGFLTQLKILADFVAKIPK